VIRDWRSAGPAERGWSLAIGNFDGVHRGHRAVLEAARAEAAVLGQRFAAMSFEPHPRRLFRPADPPFRLTLVREKLEQLRACGVERALLQRFTPGFAGLSPQAFVEDVLVAGLGVSAVAVGRDFCFGRGRAGTAPVLADLLARAGIAVQIVAPVTAADGTRYSSSAIRMALSAGDLTTAAEHLGRPVSVSARVQRGDQIGRTLGFPTANLPLGDRQPLAFGVYAVEVRLGARRFNGVANLGIRPTVAGTAPRLEVHVFDFSQDIYAQRLEVEFVSYLRPEQRFASLDQLKQQIAIDAAAARAVLEQRR
jgi:riboflavin kinase/FMN adenylyltransferase